MGQLQVMMVMIGYAENHKAKFKLYDKKKNNNNPNHIKQPAFTFTKTKIQYLLLSTIKTVRCKKTRQCI